ncbi:MAG: acyl-CoA dehydrogenase family protein [SAR324 cluster bacterium]|nr:acyl-CoA dehydrogenase family protein [SAR324 cluster bacterium]
MDLKESAELTQFRAAVREWIQANLPSEIRTVDRTYDGIEESGLMGVWYQRLAEQGWLAYRWPKEHGGPGFSEPEQIVFMDECRQQGAPIPHGFGTSMIGPILMRFGSDWQKERFLPPIARHEERWCQGYSEPNAGSDLAGLQTRAELAPDREHLIVNGQKTWTSAAGQADWIFVLVRTDPEAPKHKGISFLLVDMKSEGISVRPIKQIDGKQGFYETFFDGVKVPIQNLVGTLNAGWGIAKSLLEHERLATGSNLGLGAYLERMRRIAAEYPQGGDPVLLDSEFRQAMSRLDMDSECLRYTRFRMETAVMQGRPPGHESSIFKLFQSELFQDACDLALETMGTDSLGFYDERLSADAYELPMRMLITRAMSIYSGSNEIQRNIIAKRVLGLPD